jgi:hypothetical protein
VLWFLGMYAAGLLVFLVGLDCSPPWVYNGGRYKWQNLLRLVEREPGRPLVVMLGSSRTDHLFEACCLDGLPGPGGQPLAAYNFGAPAAGPIHEYLYLRTMLAAGIRPRLLLVEFLPVLLNERRKGLISEENWTSAPWRSLPEMIFLRPYLARPDLKFHDWLEARAVPWYFFRYHLQRGLLGLMYGGGKPDRDFIHDAWGHMIPEGPDRGEIARRLYRTRHYYRPTLQELRLGNGPSQAMRDLLECCRREGIPVALVVTPESTEFQSWYGREALAPAAEFLKELRATYDVPVLDARGWVRDEDFQDGHHVLAGGAQAFTHRLIEELRPLLAEGEEQALRRLPSGDER